MLTTTLPYCLLLLFYLLLATTTSQSPPYKATDLILLNCGSSSTSISQDDRTWNGDGQSKFLLSNARTSSASSASEQEPSVTSVPYMTARISHFQFTYSFPIVPGSKFIRLYFYPATYSNLNNSTSFFTVTANSYTLLSNFSAYLTVSDLSRKPWDAYLVKEFIVTAWNNQMLNLSFTPSPNSFAFINGIEIVSIPNNLYTKDINNPYTLVNSKTFSYFDNFTSLETAYRLNVGGGLVSNVEDTGMFRKWVDDTDYIFSAEHGIVHHSLDVKIKYTKSTPPYTAPEVVYNTIRSMGPNPHINLNYSLTWLFSVDSGFHYLLRLHFCETEKYFSHPLQRVFSVFINNMTAEESLDVIHLTNGNDIPVYKDYVVFVPEESNSSSKQDLWLALHPKSDVIYADAILNGLEIFKLNNSDGNLAGKNPELIAPATSNQQPTLAEKKKRKILSPIGAVAAAVLVFLLILLFFGYRRKGKAKVTDTSTNKSSGIDPFDYTNSSATIALSLPTDLCHHFSMAEIRACTRNFHDENIIGCGGFGHVYKGYIGGGSLPVAIKRLGASSKQGINEFHTEIEMLSRLRHVHLVSLIGYCDEEGEKILVYEFMPNGNLQDHLYRKENPSLPWKQRLQICIGAARGLHYLQTGGMRTIIHRDVKSSNILLDRNWVAKVSDFGLSKIGPTSESQTHVSTVVKGSFGYVDPEYFRRQQLTEKSDVYSFGVVLLEVLCARQPVISTLPREQMNLVEWARNCYQKGALDQIIDRQLKDDISPVSLNKFVEIAESCVRDKAIERPAMGDIVWGLEFALQLQETAGEIVTAGDADHTSQKSSTVQSKEVITTDDYDVFTISGGQASDSRCRFSSGERSGSSSGLDTISGRQASDSRCRFSSGERSGRSSGFDTVRSGFAFSELMNPQGR